MWLEILRVAGLHLHTAGAVSYSAEPLPLCLQAAPHLPARQPLP